MKVIVTGCAGFIGSNLVDSLLTSGVSVVGIDNFSTGREEFLSTAMDHENFELHRLDLQESEKLPALFEEIDFVYHLAANADVRFGADRPRKDL